MNQQADPVFESPEQPRKLNPWFSMWLHPRETIRQIMWTQSHSYHWMWVLLLLVGMDTLLDQSAGKDMGDQYSIPSIFIIAMILGPILAAAAWAVSTLFIMLAGKVLGGKATFKEVSLAMGWGLVPMAWGLALWIPELVLFGDSIFKTDIPGVEGILAGILLILFSLVEVALWFWSIVVTIGGVAEVYGFSNLKGLGTYFLAGFFAFILMLLVLVPLFIIGMIAA